MPTEQATQLAQAALQAPINTLVALVAIIALIIVLGVGFLVWKFVPVILRQIQQQLETNAKLTKIIEDGEKRAEQRTEALASLSDKTDKQNETLTAIGEKTDHQTDVLVNQTSVLENMGKVFSDHQITTHDTVANLSDKVDSLETTVNNNTEKLDALMEQIKTLVSHMEDKAACADAEERMRKICDDLLDKLTSQQAKRTTDSQPIVIIPPANVSQDTPPAIGQEAA